ncbi:MAG: polyprenyl synthetase family protein [Pseudomonadota bacterium]
MDLKAYLNERRQWVDEALRRFFPEPSGFAGDVIRAMEYSLFAGGKRLRPILCLAGARAVGGKEPDVLPMACCFELIHTYSLIHDDLPSMDNDDMRRGKPTNHKVFGEAMALLAGDGLLTEAFHHMATMDLPEGIEPRALLRVIGLVAQAAGYGGMVGGQAVDIQLEGKEVDSSLVEFIHTHKTGALISASVTAGAILGGGGDHQVDAITSYGQKIGLSFQIADDILDIEGDSRITGKGVGGDARKGKLTYPAVLGLDRSKAIQRELVEMAICSLAVFDQKADPLRHIAQYIIERRR